jgi:hypothetical protein
LSFPSVSFATRQTHTNSNRVVSVESDTLRFWAHGT